MLSLSLPFTASAQEKVHKLFKVTDAVFNVGYFEGAASNSSNPVSNSFTIGSEFGAVSWDFNGGAWWSADAGLDISGFDKLVIRVKSCVGNNVQFRIFDYNGHNGKSEYQMPDDIVESDEEIEYEVDLTEPDLLEYAKGGGSLDLTKIHNFVFWDYWDVNSGKSNPESEDYDPDWVDEYPGAEATVTISAMYLERTLKSGEKDYVNLLATNKIGFSDEWYAAEDPAYEPSSIDNTGTLHVKENAEAGLFFDDEPADWSKYKYLVVVPQKPYEEGASVIRYLLTDYDDNVLDASSFRYGFYNRARAAVQDLTAVTSTLDDNGETIDAFDVSQMSSLKFSLFGGVGTWDYGIAGMWLSNTPPVYSTSFGEGTDNTGNYVIENTAENTVMTICLPFASALCGAQVYTVTGIDDPENPSELYAAPYYGILEAGKPYIIRTNSSRNVTAFQAGSDEIAAPVANGALVADAFNTYYVGGGKNFLVLNEDGDTFEAVDDDDEIRVNSNTAYVDCSKLAQAEEQENGLVFSVSGAKPFSPTGIANVKTEGSVKKADNAIYDLSGRRISKPAKGVYIQNGKKFIVK